jgi:hypothetical protein
MLVLVASLFPCGHISAQVGKLYPVDEASKDPSFFIFRAKLLEAVQRRDSAFVIASLSPAIRTSFGGNGGVAEFRQEWKPERADSKLWSTLTTVLSLGGSFRDKHSFVAPYTFSNFPEQFDAFEYGAVIGENVRVRQKGTPDSPVIATLSFDIVKVSDWPQKPAAGSKEIWTPVVLAGGSTGYVAGTFIRSPIDYRAIFEKKDGKWMMMLLVAGD